MNFHLDYEEEFEVCDFLGGFVQNCTCGRAVKYKNFCNLSFHFYRSILLDISLFLLLIFLRRFLFTFRLNLHSTDFWRLLPRFAFTASHLCPDQKRSKRVNECALEFHHQIKANYDQLFLSVSCCFMTAHVLTRCN